MSHRDIKPDNIFIKTDQIYPRVYLADFGCSLSERLQFTNGPSEQRQGNRAYMPPEIITARVGSKLDYRAADRWSMALIALDVMFGQLAKGLFIFIESV